MLPDWVIIRCTAPGQHVFQVIVALLFAGAKKFTKPGHDSEPASTRRATQQDATGWTCAPDLSAGS
jgi:hypothetical protein